MHRLAYGVLLRFEEGAGHIVPYDTIEPASLHVGCRETAAGGELQHIVLHVVTVGGDDVGRGVGALLSCLGPGAGEDGGEDGDCRGGAVVVGEPLGLGPGYLAGIADAAHVGGHRVERADVDDACAHAAVGVLEGGVHRVDGGEDAHQGGDPQGNDGNGQG